MIARLLLFVLTTTTPETIAALGPMAARIVGTG